MSVFSLFSKRLNIYDVKSGVFEMETKSASGNSIATQYFDDFGKKSRTELRSNLLSKDGEEANIINMIIITNGDKVYSLFPESKTYMSDLEDFKDDSEDETYSEDSEVDLYNEGDFIREEKFFGKNCKVYKDVKNNGTVVTSWVWKGMELKQVANANGYKTVSEVTKLDLGVSVDNDLFEVPSDYKEKNLGLGELFKSVNKALKEQEKEAELEGKKARKSDRESLEEEKKRLAEERKALEEEKRRLDKEKKAMKEESGEKKKEDKDEVEEVIDVLKGLF